MPRRHDATADDGGVGRVGRSVSSAVVGSCTSPGPTAGHCGAGSGWPLRSRELTVGITNTDRPLDHHLHRRSLRAAASVFCTYAAQIISKVEKPAIVTRWLWAAGVAVRSSSICKK